jgi:hypothetical protein
VPYERWQSGSPQSLRRSNVTKRHTLQPEPEPEQPQPEQPQLVVELKFLYQVSGFLLPQPVVVEQPESEQPVVELTFLVQLPGFLWPQPYPEQPEPELPFLV